MIYPTGGSRKGKVSGSELMQICSLYRKGQGGLVECKIMFEEATDDQIDSFIYKMNAYERKYIYLLKMAKGEKLNVFQS